MSAALRAAIAAKRAALNKKQTSETTVVSQQSSDETCSDVDQLEEQVTIAQATLPSLLLKSCTTGKLNLASRLPQLTVLPNSVFDLLADAPPTWYKGQRPWYERVDLISLVLANNAIQECQENIQEFTALQRLDLHNNRLPLLPPSISHLSHLTHLNLSGNQLTTFPPPLLALDTLLELDLSTNRLDALWQATDIAASRSELEAWQAKRGDEETGGGGVWASFMASPTSSKSNEQGRAKGGLPVDSRKPLASLRVLSLANNRLTNASLGLSPTSTTDDEIDLPPSLTSLDLSDNFLRGPLPITLFGRLQSLAVLDLGGNGLSQIFSSSPSPSSTSSTTTLFPSLHTLDIHRCELDDLSPLESTFGSPRAIAQGEKPHLAGVSVAAPHQGIKARQLVSGATRRPAGDIYTAAAGASLYVILEGNPLREEAFRRKRTPTNPLSPSSGSAGGLRIVSAEVMASALSCGTSSAPKKQEAPLRQREEAERQSMLSQAPNRRRGEHNSSSLAMGAESEDEFGALGQRPSGKPTPGLALAPKSKTPAVHSSKEEHISKQNNEASSVSASVPTLAAAAVPAAPRTRRRGAGMEQSTEMWQALGGGDATGAAASSSISFSSAPSSATTVPVVSPSASGTRGGAGGMTDWGAPLTEGAKRRLRAEAARMAAEEEAVRARGAPTNARNAPGTSNGRAARQTDEWGPL